MMALATHRETGIPFIEDIEVTIDLPHTLSFVVMYVHKLNSFAELPKEKQPPRGIWDKPYKLERFFDEVFSSSNHQKPETLSIEFDPEEVE
jgi:hypothetical protein